MARVPYLETSDLAPEDQDLLKRPISLFKALVNSPKAARAFSGLGGYIRHDLYPTSPEAQSLLRVIILSVSGQNIIFALPCPWTSALVPWRQSLRISRTNTRSPNRKHSSMDEPNAFA